MAGYKMDAFEYLETVKRMSVEDMDGFLKLVALGNGGPDVSAAKVAFVSQWYSQHGGTTRLQDFVGKYPMAPRKGDGVPDACCKKLGYTKVCPMSYKAMASRMAGMLDTGVTPAGAAKYCYDCWHKRLGAN